VSRVAPTRATVLVTGETGTGKELVALAIHDASSRAYGPFVAVNCSALAESVLESELFGHVKGAFTGATNSKRGLFQVASGGTLFLDEVGTLTPAIQVKLLRVIQQRTISPVGSHAVIPVDFRLVAATNHDLALLVKNGSFRKDLFYRLQVFNIHVPPLRSRAEDIPLLADHFRRRFAREHGLEAPPFSATAQMRMRTFPWPGNVRELENAVERSLIIHADDAFLSLELPADVHSPGDADRLLDRARTERWSLEDLEREYILSTLDAAGGRRSETARSLGISRRTLYRKLQRYREKMT
ncbi:MAG: sigma-54 dependent transcriptional regulator, partial [Gemmatimonadota bacterium]|nr:sigma-54 dependent transcriptional regulator [Gemmatimonadota bacterium]